MAEKATKSSSVGVLLLSGGLDSTTTLAMAKQRHERLYALSFRYGQRHEVELGCAARQAKNFGVVAHEVVDLSAISVLLRSSTALLADSPLQVPNADSGEHDDNRPADSSTNSSSGIPTTYVPARNTLFLSYALAWAEALDARDLWIGANAVDYSGYPDCRPEFLSAFEELANRGTKAGVEGDSFRVHAPLIDLHKHEIISKGIELGVDYSDTVSCYNPTSRGQTVYACGRCESCTFRRQGFERAGVEDPTRYLAEDGRVDGGVHS